MIWLSMAMAFAARALLVALFLPFSALDKILNFKAAVGQAAEAIPSRRWRGSRSSPGCGVEVVMSLAVLTGVADRMAATILGRLLRGHRAAVEAILEGAGFPVARDQRAAGTSSGIF